MGRESRYQKILREEGPAAARNYLKEVRRKASMSRRNKVGYFKDPGIASEMGRKRWQHEDSDKRPSTES